MNQSPAKKSMEEEPENPSSSSNGGIKEPLLGHHHHQDHSSAPPEEDLHSTTPGSPPFGYNHGSRPCRDIAFFILFLLLTVASLALGIFSIARHNPDFRWSEPPHYIRNQSLCSAPAKNSPENEAFSALSSFSWGFSDRNRGSEPVSGKSPENISSSARKSPSSGGNPDFEQVSGENPPHSPSESKNRSFSGAFSWLSSGWRLRGTRKAAGFQAFSGFSSASETLKISLISSLAATLLLSIPLVLLLIQLLRRFTKELVFVSLPLFVVLPAALNILWFVVCTRDSVCQENVTLPVRILFLVLVFVFCGVIAWIIFANLARVELTARVITTAAEALFGNLSLLLLIPGLSILLVVFFVPGVVFIGYSYMNGEYVVNPEVVSGDGGEIQCGRGIGVECCVWRTERWVPAYVTLAVVTLLWAASLVAQVKVYVISGTIGQWYFAGVGTHRPLSAMKKSLGQAFTSSFGTLCFSSLIFAIVRLVRNAVDSATDSEGREGLALSFLRCCYDWLLKAIEFLTKFTIDFAAITGDSFCVSARKTYELLTNNLLSTVFVEVISTRLLGGVMFVVSVIYAVAVWGVLRGATNLDNRIFLVTIAAWLLLLVILSVFIAVMNIIVDTVYICYAMDKDKGVVSKPEAHDVYVLLPVSQHERATLAVRQPDSQA